jgi:hypothetical protein
MPMSGLLARPWSAVLVTGVVLILAYEVRSHLGTDYPTLTALIRQWQEDYPMVGVSVGMVVGHLFWCLR